MVKVVKVAKAVMAKVVTVKVKVKTHMVRTTLSKGVMAPKGVSTTKTEDTSRATAKTLMGNNKAARLMAVVNMESQTMVRINRFNNAKVISNKDTVTNNKGTVNNNKGTVNSSKDTINKVNLMEDLQDQTVPRTANVVF